MRSFQHCPICAWTKQALCTHVDASPVWLKELRTNFEKKELVGIFATPPHYKQQSITLFPFAPNVKQKVENVQVPAPTLPSFSIVTNIKSGILER